jgi:hypothetical protein
MISWRTDGSAGAIDTVRNWLEENSNHTDYISWADNNGRTDYKWEIVAGDIVITEEWSIDRAAYDALGIDHTANGETLPLVETNDHLAFAE